MPLPSPKPGEEQDKWIPRCMGNDAMKEEFPDQKQRQAVCQQKWRDKDKKSMTPREATKDRWDKAVPIGYERRSGPQGELRVAEDDDGKMATISGYAALYGVLSEDLGGFRERIQRGAFTRTLADKADVRALVDHQTGLMTLARTANDTLELTEDSKGLHVRFTSPDTNAGRDVVELVRLGTLSQQSFAFRVPKGGQGWEEDEDGTIRTVLDLDLFDISIVTYAAYPQTNVNVAVRSLAAWQTERDRAAENQRELNKRLLDSRAEIG